jgi:hypothetical protein
MLPLQSRCSAYVNDVHTRVEVEPINGKIVWVGYFVVSQAFGARFTVDVKERWRRGGVFGDAMRIGESMPPMQQSHMVDINYFYNTRSNSRGPGED